jgi:cytochrome c556
MLKPRAVTGVVLSIAIAAVAVVSAQRRGGPPEGGAAPAPKPYLPVGTTVLGKNPDPYVGENVTLTAAVDTVLSKSAFAIDQRVNRAPAGHAVLVIAPILNGPVEPKKYVTVAGELVRFDPAEIAKKIKGYQVDLPADIVERFRGRLTVIAKVVVNDAMVDLAMRLPPPMSPEERVLDDTMKKVGPSFAALRSGVDGSKADVAAENAAVLRQAFAQTETFWKGKAVAEAAGLAQSARSHVDAIERAAASGNWDEAVKFVAILNQSCQACHASYRERFDDGSFRVKLGGQPQTSSPRH